MKRLFKISLLLVVCFMLVVGCKKKPVEDPVEEPTPVDNIKEELNKKVVIEDLGVFDGELGERDGLLKITNNNDVAVYVRVSLEMLDSNKNVINTKEKYVRVGKNNSAYVVIRQEYDEAKYASYTYTSEIDEEKIEDYDSIFKKIDISYKETSDNIVVSVINKGNRTTTVYGLLIFYKNNKIVAVSEATEYNLMHTSTRNIEVRYPLEKIGKKISYDRIYLVLNEVSTEL